MVPDKMEMDNSHVLLEVVYLRRSVICQSLEAKHCGLRTVPWVVELRILETGCRQATNTANPAFDK